MMGFKRIVILAILFFILLVLYYFFETPHADKSSGEHDRFIPRLARQEIVSIRIKSPEKGEVNLKKENGIWKVFSDNKTFTADTEPVNKLFEAVENIKTETVVSKNPENFGVFEVSESKGIEVIIEDSSKKTSVRFFVGKSGPDIFSTYVRAENQDRVILTPGILKTVFELGLTGWRDKTIFKLNKNSIIEYRVKGNFSLHLKKDEKNNWHVLAPENFSPKQETVEVIMEKFSKLKAAGFPEGVLSEFGLDKPALRITAVLKNGTTEILLVGRNKNAFQHFVKTDDRNTVYLIEDYELNLLFPPLDSLKKNDKTTDNTTD